MSIPKSFPDYSLISHAEVKTALSRTAPEKITQGIEKCANFSDKLVLVVENLAKTIFAKIIELLNRISNESWTTDKSVMKKIEHNITYIRKEITDNPGAHLYAPALKNAITDMKEICTSLKSAGSNKDVIEKFEENLEVANLEFSALFEKALQTEIQSAQENVNQLIDLLENDDQLKNDQRIGDMKQFASSLGSQSLDQIDVLADNLEQLVLDFRQIMVDNNRAVSGDQGTVTYTNIEQDLKFSKAADKILDNVHHFDEILSQKAE